MNYWQKRYKELEKNITKDEDKLRKKLSFFYDKERVSLEKEIASFYQRYGENNIIEYRNLLQSLSAEEKDMLIKRTDDFIDKYPKYKNILPVRENIYKLNRLEGLQYSILLKQYEIGAIEREEIEEHLRKYALKGANIAYETLGFGKNFLSINSDVINKILDNAYAGEENFSDRIWNNKKKLADYLNKDFAQAVARGDSYDKCVKSLRERFSKVTRNDCYRLIFTEGTYVLNESTITPFEEDFENYEISTIGDGKVCAICRGIQGKVFDIKERTPGVNFPPLHPWCRCGFEIVVDDWDKWLDEYESKHGKNGDKIKNRLQESYDNSIIDKKDEKAIKDYMSFNAYIINEALRKKLPLEKSEKELIKNLDIALKKMPFYKGDVTRSLKFDNDEETDEFAANYIIGKTVKYDGYTSTTKAKGWYNPEGQVQIYIKNSKKGRDISDYNRAELEVLYERGSSFVVKKIRKEEGKYFILLEEE